MTKKQIIPIQGEILFYQSRDGKLKLETRFVSETVWLTQKQLAELFQTTVPNINSHIRNILAEGELDATSVIKEFLITASDCKAYLTKHYNLDIIISVGYRIKSAVATHFRQWASHGNTAAEIIFARADSTKPNMGLTNWPGSEPHRADIEIAKNYLKEGELDILNRIVTMYLDFAELQALNRKPMHMKDWIIKLDEFLKLSGREILCHAGKIAHEEALQKAHLEYDKWHREQLDQPTEVEKHFVEVVRELEQLKHKSPKRNTKTDKLSYKREK